MRGVPELTGQNIQNLQFGENCVISLFITTNETAPAPFFALHTFFNFGMASFVFGSFLVEK